MVSLESFLFVVCVYCQLSNAQYWNGYDRYGNIPTEIIDLGPNEDFPNLKSVLYNPRQVYPYPYVQNPLISNNMADNGYGSRNIDVIKSAKTNRNTYPKYLFQNANERYPHGYFVIPANDLAGSIDGNNVIQDQQNSPKYKITKSSENFYTTNVEPKRTFSTTSELKPLQTVVNRYFDRNSGKPVVVVEANGKIHRMNSENGNTIDKKFVMNVSNNSSDMKEVAPHVIEATVETTTEATQETTTTTFETSTFPLITTTTNPNPEDILSWFS